MPQLLHFGHTFVAKTLKKYRLNWRAFIGFPLRILKVCVWRLCGLYTIRITAKKLPIYLHEKNANINHHFSKLFLHDVCALHFYVLSGAFLACRIMIALLFQTESNRLQFFKVLYGEGTEWQACWGETRIIHQAAGRRSSATRELDVSNCRPLSVPIERAGVGIVVRLLCPQADNRRTQDI